MVIACNFHLLSRLQHPAYKFFLQYLTRSPLSLMVLLIVNEECTGASTGVMGRRKGERRLADQVFKMVDESMTGFVQSENFEDRPSQCAYSSGKLPCPSIPCRGEAGKVFFEEKGLAQHFRAKHVRVFFE